MIELKFDDKAGGISANTYLQCVRGTSGADPEKSSTSASSKEPSRKKVQQDIKRCSLLQSSAKGEPSDTVITSYEEVEMILGKIRVKGTDRLFGAQ